MSDTAESEVARELSLHPKRDALSRLVATVALSAADERRTRFGDGLDELLQEAELTPTDGEIASFNVLKALTRAEPPVARGRELLARLCVRGIQLQAPAEADRPRVAEGLAWLAAHTFLDPLSVMDEELDPETAVWAWSALGAIVTAAAERGAPKGRAEALAAAAALAVSRSIAAAEERARLALAVRDPLLSAVLRPASAIPGGGVPSAEPEPAAPEVPAQSMSGEIVPTPLGPVGLFFWTATGLIVVRYIFRFVANVLLRCRRPVEVTVARAGVTMKSQLDVLGRTVRKREVHIPVQNLAHAVREVRYPRLAMYAGLVMLAIGTYVGVSLVSDGVSAGSPSLLALGAGVFALGVICDLVFANLLPAKQGKHRVLFVPRKGRTVAVRTSDAAAADRALRVLMGTT